jgi:hypothetical protein
VTFHHGARREAFTAKTNFSLQKLFSFRRGEAAARPSSFFPEGKSVMKTAKIFRCTLFVVALEVLRSTAFSQETAAAVPPVSPSPETTGVAPAPGVPAGDGSVVAVPADPAAASPGQPAVSAQDAAVPPLPDAAAPAAPANPVPTPTDPAAVSADPATMPANPAAVSADPAPGTGEAMPALALENPAAAPGTEMPATDAAASANPEATGEAAAAASGASVAPPPPSAEPAPSALDLSLPGTAITGREAGNKLWRLHPSLGLGFTYDDNISLSHDHKLSDEIFTLSGGLAFEMGDYRNLRENYLLAQYRADAFLFAHNSGEDSVNQFGSLRTQFRFSKLTLQTDTQVQYLTGADRSVGNFVDHYFVGNVVRLLDDISDKTQAFLGFEQSTNLYPSYLSSYEYILRGGADYQVTPKIKLGGEAVLGALDQEASPLSIYGQLRLRANYQWTEKFSLQLSAGGEVRHYDGDGSSATPVFSLGATWRPFLDTSVVVNGYRNVNASPLYASTNYVATGVSVQLSQLWFHRLTTGVTVGYENDSYQSETSGSTLGSRRQDNYLYVTPALSYNLNKWLSATLSYEFRKNTSNESSLGFTDNRVSFKLGISF